jgi:hypothetical protein
MKYKLGLYGRLFGIRVSYYDIGPPVVEVSELAPAGHLHDGDACRRDASRAVMIRFRGDRILFTGTLEPGEMVECVDERVEATIKRHQAAKIQKAFRRFQDMGEPRLTMPPLWTI